MEARLCFSFKWEVKAHSEDRQTRQWFYWVGGGDLFLVSNFISECLLNHLVLGMKQPLSPLCHCIFLSRLWGSLRASTPSGARPPHLIPSLPAWPVQGQHLAGCGSSGLRWSKVSGCALL